MWCLTPTSPLAQQCDRFRTLQPAGMGRVGAGKQQRVAERRALDHFLAPSDMPGKFRADRQIRAAIEQQFEPLQTFVVELRGGMEDRRLAARCRWRVYVGAAIEQELRGFGNCNTPPPRCSSVPPPSAAAAWRCCRSRARENGDGSADFVELSVEIEPPRRISSSRRVHTCVTAPESEQHIDAYGQVRSSADRTGSRNRARSGIFSSGAQFGLAPWSSSQRSAAGSTVSQGAKMIGIIPAAFGVHVGAVRDQKLHHGNPIGVERGPHQRRRLRPGERRSHSRSSIAPSRVESVPAAPTARGIRPPR